MAFTVTAKTRSILNQIEKNPSILLDIEGIDFVTSSSATFTVNRWDGDLKWDQEGVFWDGSKENDNIKSYINLKQSTNVISQQIFPDKEGSSSISTFTISMVDKNGEASKAFALNTITEILGKKCTVYLGFRGASYPEDYISLINGFIVDYFYNAGSVNITVSHADGLRKQAILPEYSSNLNGAINVVQTTITVDSTADFLPSQDALTSYIKIDDEIMQVVSVDSDTQFTVIREAFSTLGNIHADDADIKSFYNLVGTPLDLAQKLMLSDSDNSFFTSDIPLFALNYTGSGELINAVVFSSYDIERETGLIPGDTINIDTIGELTIESFGTLNSGLSYAIVEETLTTNEDISNLTWSFRSQYNVLNFGLAMLPFEVDNKSIESIKSLFSVNFIEMTFPIESGIDNCRDFINKELYFAASCYGIPRNGRSSVRFLSPPLTFESLPTLNETNILNMTDLKPIRSINKFYYNDILFAFNKSFIDGEFKSFTKFIDADSLNRFNVGKKQLRIESQGYDRGSITDITLDRIASRFLDRYKKAATYIKGIKLPLKTGFNLQVGDVVFFGGENTKIADYNTGLRSLPLEKYEIINQKINLTGTVEIDILSTGFAIDGVFGVFSPASYVSSATITSIIVSKLNNLDEVANEGDKYIDFVGAKLRVRSEDYSYDETVTLESIDLQNANKLNVSEFSAIPSVDCIVELAEYDQQDDLGSNDVIDLIKQKYTFTMVSQRIISVASASEFDVENGSEFYIGQTVAVRDGTFTRDQESATIANISGNTITLSEALPFTPLAQDIIEQKSWEDGLDAYLFL